MALGDRSLPREPGISAPLEFREATGQAPGSIVSHSSISGQKSSPPTSRFPPIRPRAAAGASKLALGPGAFLLTTILAALAITGSLVLSFLNSRALARKMRELESRTQTVFNGAPIAAAPTGVREFDGLGDARARTSEFLSLRSDQQRDADQGCKRARNCKRAKNISGFCPTACRNWFGRRVPTAALIIPARAAKNTQQSGGPTGKESSIRTIGGRPRKHGSARASPVSPMKWSTACLRSEKDTRGT